MTPEQIREYANRDWALIARYKAKYWEEQCITPESRRRIAAELYKSVRARRPDWPNAAEREADLEAHVRLSEKLRAVQIRRR